MEKLMSPTKFISRSAGRALIWIVVLCSTGAAAYATVDRWLPITQQWVSYLRNEQPVEVDAADSKGLEIAPDTLALTPSAWKNIGLKVGVVAPADFVKQVSVPAMVVERPGRSQIKISAPMTGIITQVYPLEREAIGPGDKLFDLRLTHEDVVSAQSDFLTQLQVLDVTTRELNRLQGIGESVIPGKRIVEQEYKRDQAQASLQALRQSLLLHGMSEQQVAQIEDSRNLLREITVTAPPYAENHEHAAAEHQYHIQSINVNRGQSVMAGDLLGVLADHCLLYVEGQAFEQEANRLLDASQAGRRIPVVPVSSSQPDAEILTLALQSVADQVDRQSRALKFYLLLDNQLMDYSDRGTKFVAWKYRPGQRMEARIPTSQVLKNKIVLPAAAVAIEGPNAFVFEQNGDHFDRIDVQVLYRDKDTVVLENDGQLVGSYLAYSGAYQMHLALKNQSGGAIDPHAGHSH
jgi:cobalt-zinc-cadmium efflux system membrane fusion protein